jgi:hypothetical protein
MLLEDILWPVVTFTITGAGNPIRTDVIHGIARLYVLWTPVKVDALPLLKAVLMLAHGALWAFVIDLAHDSPIGRVARATSSIAAACANVA